MKYKPTIGLEIHAELQTVTKMFCNSRNDPEEKRPNVNICPVCMGHPGTLPVINRQAVEHVIRVGLAVGGEIADFTEFDRKNYFYPDIPKGYQISQYAYPLVTGGELSGVKLTRIHLEEDTARSTHKTGEEYSLVDFNRAGVPLMELVTEPVIHDAETASAFARELQLLLQYLGAGKAQMEKGEMRVEANISVSDSNKLGTKVEVKNLNSFKAVEKAIAFEIERQVTLLEKGEKVTQETRGWDENNGETFSQRKKEDSHDYRYFPDPDLPKLKISLVDDFALDSLRESLGELPREKRERFKKVWGLEDQHVDFYIQSREWANFFETTVSHLSDSKQAKKLSNYIVTDVAGSIKEHMQITEEKVGELTGGSLADIISMIDEGTLSSRGAKDLIQILLTEGGHAKAVAERHSLIQTSNEGDLMPLIEEVLTENRDVVEEYKDGKEASLKFLIGQVMKKSRGSANPTLVSDLLRRCID